MPLSKSVRKPSDSNRKKPKPPKSSMSNSVRMPLLDSKAGSSSVREKMSSRINGQHVAQPTHTREGKLQVHK
jgi:hypothetical protein